MLTNTTFSEFYYQELNRKLVIEEIDRNNELKTNRKNVFEQKRSK